MTIPTEKEYVQKSPQLMIQLGQAQTTFVDRQTNSVVRLIRRRRSFSVCDYAIMIVEKFIK